MHKIHKLLEQIQLEFETAEDYIHCASKSEDYCKDVYKSLARDELEHVDKLIATGNKSGYTKETKEADVWSFVVEHSRNKISMLKYKLSSID